MKNSKSTGITFLFAILMMLCKQGVTQSAKSDYRDQSIPVLMLQPCPTETDHSNPGEIDPPYRDKLSFAFLPSNN